MNDVDLKFLLKSLVGCISALTEKQAIILQLLAKELPSLPEDSRKKLLTSADEDHRRVETLNTALGRVV